MRQNLRFLRGVGFKTLVMDGTSWTIGEAKVHYLVLSVLVGSVAVPIYWVQLEKIGASNQEERKAMFEEAFSLFDLQGMTLLADREYIGKDYGRMQGKCALKNKLVKKQIFLDGEAYTIVMLPNPKFDADEPVMIF